MRYVNRFLLRRRKGEFALYELMGMGCGAMVLVLIAAEACMMVAGFAFSVGLHTPKIVSNGVAASLAPIGYIGTFYGSVFLLIAVAVLSLQQLSSAAEARRAYGTLAQLSCDLIDICSSARAQVHLYFCAPLAWAFINDLFDLVLMAFLSLALFTQGFFAVVESVLGFTVMLMAVYALMTSHAVERVVLPRV